MTALEITISNALLDAKEVLTQMLALGIADTKSVFKLSFMLSEKYNLSQEQTIMIIENAIKMN